MIADIIVIDYIQNNGDLNQFIEITLSSNKSQQKYSYSNEYDLHIKILDDKVIR